MSNARLPDFFLIGAPKCGTSALYRYLCAHPDVFDPGLKEPNFFCSDFKTGRIASQDKYLELFAKAGPERITGDGTIWNLFSEVAVADIMAARPDAKITVMLRKPSVGAQSLHSQLLYAAVEDIEDFEEAWRAQAARAKGKRIPKACTEPRFLQYGAVYRFSSQLKRVLKYVPRAQLHVAIYEEFFAEPQRHYADVLRFLGLSQNQAVEFSVVNAAKAVRSRVLARALLRIAPIHAGGPLEELYAPIRPLLHKLGIHPRRLLRQANRKPANRIPLSAAFIGELDRFFADDVAALEEILGRSLDVWR